MIKIKPLMILLTILLIVGSGCSFVPVKPIPITRIEIPETPMPTNKLLLRISNMKEKIGKALAPTKIKQNGKTYIAFTQEQMRKLVARNELLKYLENTVKLMHERGKIYVMELNQLKRLAAVQNMEIDHLQRIYVRSKNDVKSLERQSRIDGITYKIVIAGELIVILKLLLML